MKRQSVDAASTRNFLVDVGPPPASQTDMAASERRQTVRHLESEIPRPRTHELPADYAARLAERFSTLTSLDQRRQRGQFFTPVEVARFMSSLFPSPHTIRRALDPGAGTGVLACALCESAIQKGQDVRFDAFEADPELAACCELALRYARKWLSDRGARLSYKVYTTDFVLKCADTLNPGLFAEGVNDSYDAIISNPPYFKLAGADPRSRAASPVIHGQPNIYAIFMAISASLLSEKGVMVTITPRSFATGDYFRRCRQYLFSRVTPEAIHLFDSRKEAFKSDTVLQENVILCTRKATPHPASRVRISTSTGPQDIKESKAREVSLSSVLDLNSPKVVFHIPAEDTDEAILHFVREWPNTLHTLGLEVSTGPVVAFRARKFLQGHSRGHLRSAPLLWLQNVRQQFIRWPLERKGKPQYILDAPDSEYLLVRNQTCVVLRRFSAKEEERRLVAAPLLEGFLPGLHIGLENHLNYIHRPKGTMEENEAIGLASLLGSSLLDRYFRISNGNTQVNATELRGLPLPSRETLVELGRMVKNQIHTQPDIDTLCEKLLALPRWLSRLSKAG